MATPRTTAATIETMLIELIDSRIAMAIRCTGLVYTNDRGRTATWPPGAKNARSARDRIRAVPGHTRTGEGPATVWSVGVDAYHAHHSRRVVALVTPTDLAEQIADEALAAAGFRATKRTA